MRYLQANPATEKIRLDAKDKKIIGLLVLNARLPLTQLAKKVGLSRDAVSYRIQNYEKKGLIQGYRTLVDLHALGYHAHHLFARLNNPGKEQEAAIIKKLTSHPFVRAVLKFTNGYDLEIAFVAKDTASLDNAVTRLVSDCQDLQDVELITLSKTFATGPMPKSFLPSSSPLPRPALTVHPDDKDLAILKILGEDATAKLHSIAHSVGLSADAVAYRIKHMVSSGLIVKFFPIINYEPINHSMYVFLVSIRNLDRQNEELLKGFIAANQHIFWAVKTVGKYNVLLYALVPDMDALHNTATGLRQLFPGGINHFEVLIAYEEYKFVYFPKELF